MNIILMIFSMFFGQDTMRHAGYSYLLTRCPDGGFYMDGLDMLCWGDNREQVDTIMYGREHTRSSYFPKWNNSSEYSGGSYFDMDIDHVLCHYDSKGGLDEVSIVFTNYEDELTYNIMNSRYLWIRKIFDKKAHYSLGMAIEDFSYVRSTKPEEVFSGKYKECGDTCGVDELNGEILDKQVIAFMTGKAVQYAQYSNPESMASISIRVNKWVLHNKKTGESRQYGLKYPNVTLIYSKPRTNKTRESGEK